jgi:enoyl-CoA hydratase
MPYQDIAVTQQGHVMTVRFNRPALMNALRFNTFEELHQAFEAAADAPEVHAVLLTGSGRAFSAGADLTELGETLVNEPTAAQQQARVALLNRVQDLTRRIATFPKITVAAINQVAVGFGAEIPLAFDVRVVASSARLAFPEATRGLCQTNGSYYYLPRLVGLARAQHLLFTGEAVSGQEAVAMGLATRLFSDEGFDDAALAFVQGLVKRAPMSVALIKRAFSSAVHESLEASLQFETEGMHAAMASADLREGVAAFHERREPKFVGR